MRIRTSPSLSSYVHLATAAMVVAGSVGCSSDAFIGSESGDGAAGSSGSASSGSASSGSASSGSASSGSASSGSASSGSASSGSASSGSASSGSASSGSASSGSASSGSASSGSSSDAGICCAPGWDLHACTYPDGGTGMACHNPAMGCASSTTCGQGCDAVVTGSCGASVDGGSGGLKWWYGCGESLCRAPADGGADGGLRDDAGTACPAVGSACSTTGETCGTRNAQINCGAIEQCSATDPTKSFGGCPVSSRNFKNHIHYVDDAQLEQLHEQALAIRLATYNYKPQFDDPNPTHLGFIVEDDPRSPAVDRGYDRVDMYGYISMVVATMQVQEKEIAALRRELEEERTSGSTSSTP